MSTQQAIEIFLLQHVAPANRDAAREDMCAIVNREVMAARRDELERGLEAAAAREEARGS